jgi:glycosyltransferase involved in cell wall biosynthesis
VSEGPRILVVANGIDRSEAAIFAGLQAAGLSLTVLHDPEAAATSVRTMVDAGIPCTSFSVRHRLDSAAVRDLRRRLRDGTFDLVYAPINRTLSAALLATRGLRIPVVGYRGTVGHLFRWDPTSWLTYFHPRLAHIVCVSEAVRRYLVADRHLPAERVSRIYKGHDPAWYAGLAPDAPLPPAAAGTLTVGFVGRIRPVKGVRYLLDALRWIPPDEPVRIVLIGAISDPAVRRQLGDPALRGRVLELGHRTDAAALIGQCDVLAMPSVAREGLPRAVVEAMSQGVPVVASRVGGLPEVVADGRTGLIVPPRDARALAEALRRLRGDAAFRAALGAAGRVRVEEDFHVGRSIAAFEALFRRLSAVPGRT